MPAAGGGPTCPLRSGTSLAHSKQRSCIALCKLRATALRTAARTFPLLTWVAPLLDNLAHSVLSARRCGLEHGPGGRRKSLRPKKEPTRELHCYPLLHCCSAEQWSLAASHQWRGIPPHPPFSRVFCGGAAPLWPPLGSLAHSTLSSGGCGRVEWVAGTLLATTVASHCRT